MEFKLEIEENVSFTQSQHPFLHYALKYHSLSLPIIPCLGDSGKVACVKWKEYRETAPSKKIISAWQSQFPNSNIGLITGSVSNITVVDIDSAKPTFIKQMIEFFGDTPIKVKTPSGGIHLYYQFNDEKCHTRVSGLPVDIKSYGGYVIAPPSINPDLKSNYKFLEGDLSKISNLPKINKGALPNDSQCNKEPNLTEGDIAYEGNRNHALFKALLIRARDCPTLEAMEDTAYFLNESNIEPCLHSNEVEKVIQNVWKIKIENRLYGDGERFLTMLSSEIRDFKSCPDAFWLLANLKNSHENKRKKFVISINAMSKAIGWSESRLIIARDKLIELRYLKYENRKFHLR